jgi:hypothetical protein
MDFQDTNTALKDQARECEVFEGKVLGLVADWLKASPEVNISYPASFDITKLDQDIDSALKLVTLNMGKSFNDKMRKRIVSKTFPGIDSKELETVSSEFGEINSGSSSPQTLTQETDNVN